MNQREQLHVKHVQFVQVHEDSGVMGINKSYDADGYSSMSYDSERNAAYRQGMKSWSQKYSGGKGRTVLEIGPGADGCLTKMMVKAAPRLHALLAVEQNPKSAKRAKEALEHLHCVSVVCAASQDAVLGDPDLVLHEILGYFASREGIGGVLRDLGERLPPKPARHWIPAAFGTFFTPSFYTEGKQLAGKHFPVRMAVDYPFLAFANKNAFISQSEVHPFWPQIGQLEWFDMYHELELSQQVSIVTFHADKDVAINSLHFFLWVGFQDFDEPSPKLAPFHSYEDLDNKRWVSTTQSVGIQNCPPTTTRSSNWSSVVVFFREVVKFTPLDLLTITTTSLLSSELPSYSIEVEALHDDTVYKESFFIN